MKDTRLRFPLLCVWCLALPTIAGQVDDPAQPAAPQQGNAQNPGPGPAPDGGPGFGPGFGPGPRGFMRGSATAGLESVKAKIRASDEEWKVIGPKLQRVIFARQAADSDINADNSSPVDGSGSPANRRPGGGRGGPGNDAFAGPSSRIGGDFGPGGGPPPFGPGGGPPPFGPGGGPPPFGPGGGPPPFGPGGGPPPGFGGQDGAVTQALANLRAALADPKTTPQELQEKVSEVRAARQRVRRDLAIAEKDLLELLTVDQEATLVSLGYID